MNISNFAKQVLLFRPLIMNADPVKNVYSSDIQNFIIIQIIYIDIYKLVPFQLQSILAKTLQENCLN